jgi:hypothetical protein
MIQVCQSTVRSQWLTASRTHKIKTDPLPKFAKSTRRGVYAVELRLAEQYPNHSIDVRLIDNSPEHQRAEVHRAPKDDPTEASKVEDQIVTELVAERELTSVEFIEQLREEWEED